MNRIILIGNGFDLAHDLKTSYKDVLDNYWEIKINNIVNRSFGGRTFEDDEIKIEKTPTHQLRGCRTYSELIDNLKRCYEKLIFKNEFLKIITEHNNINSWVDIENEYYKLLINAFKGARQAPYSGDILGLNRDFEFIKKHISSYLKTVDEDLHISVKNNEKDRISKTIGSKIFAKYKLIDLSEMSKAKKIDEQFTRFENNWRKVMGDKLLIEKMSRNDQMMFEKFEEFPTKKKFRDFMLDDHYSSRFELYPDNTLLLSFNYTSTPKLYLYASKFDYPGHVKGRNVSMIQIHGSVHEEDKNPIIFGYGDELDDNYQEIEKLNNNSYLENIKSIKYLDTGNYKKLLEFINTDDYQIFLMGHSSGNSDRTMLNTLFEHDNCASIKVFYHQKSEEVDNYSDVIMNVSRNFNDKAKMRDRVVNKGDCERYCNTIIFYFDIFFLGYQLQICLYS